MESDLAFSRSRGVCQKAKFMLFVQSSGTFRFPTHRSDSTVRIHRRSSTHRTVLWLREAISVWRCRLNRRALMLTLGSLLYYLPHLAQPRTHALCWAHSCSCHSLYQCSMQFCNPVVVRNVCHASWNTLSVLSSCKPSIYMISIYCRIVMQSISHCRWPPGRRRW